MNNTTVIAILRQYNKWRRGKGKKYSQPGFPFDTKEIGEAIDHAVEHLGYRLPPSEFIEIVSAAASTEKRIRRWIRDISKNKKMDDDTKRVLDDASSRIEILSPAVKMAKRICIRLERRINKSEK